MPTVRNATMQRVLTLLEDGKPRTCPEIAAELNMDAANMSSTVKRLQELKRVNVSSYRRNSMSKPVKLWTAGSGKDARKPGSATKAERNALARQRAKLAAETLERERMKQASPFRHWQDQVLFGSYQKPFTPTIPRGRIYAQPMSVTDDEMEAA